MDETEITSDFDDRPLAYLTIGEVVENRAAALGGKPFAHYGHDDRTVTYAELDAITDRIAGTLAARGIEPGDHVGVLMKDALRTVLVMYATTKCGAVYAPVDWHYRGQPLTYQLNDSDPDVLLVEDRYVDRLNDVRADLDAHPDLVVCETADGGAAADGFGTIRYEDWLLADPDPPAVDVAWNDPAWLVYTSGTTGFPKGAVLSHRAVLANLAGYVSLIHDTDDVFHSPAPLYHIGGAGYAVTSMLICGGSVALWDRFSTSEFWDRIEKYGATSTIVIGVMLDWLSKLPERDDDAHTTLHKVDMQPLPEDLTDVATRFGFDLITTSFGQTESGLSITGAIRPPGGPHTPPDLVHGKTPDEAAETLERIGVPVVEEPPGERYLGRPRRSLFEVAILDRNDERLPAGETGQIALRPKLPNAVLAEYLGDPEKSYETVRNFWFHTGDIGYRDEEGNVYFVDRDHFIIRRRGENVSSRHLEETINRHERVRRSAAYPVPAEEGGEDEIAVTVEVDDAEPFTGDDLRAFLDERLPGFMLPKYVTVSRGMPTTETNKIRKSEVRERFLESRDL